LRDGTKPKAGPAAMLGGPPAVAVPAAATVARHTLATTAATIGFKLIWTPFRSEAGRNGDTDNDRLAGSGQ
jgi:hypothetical protein